MQTFKVNPTESEKDNDLRIKKFVTPFVQGINDRLDEAIKETSRRKLEEERDRCGC